MKNLLALIIINLIVPLLLLLILPSLIIRTRNGISSDTGNTVLPLVSDKSYSFNFISDHSNLQTIFLFLKNPNILNNSEVNVNISAKNITRSLVFYGSNVGDPGTIPLKFNYFPLSSGQTFTVTITTKNTDPNSLYILTDNSRSPLFKTSYYQPDFFKNLSNNFFYQTNLFLHRSIYHNLFYISLILFLDLILIFYDKKKIKI